MTGTEPAIAVRQVSQLHAHWRDNGDGVPGTFALSILLDDGALEVVGIAHPRDIQALIPLLAVVGGSAFLDLERGVVTISGVSLPVRRL
ncbi:hypothetical protein EV383_0659 [Pseudonocardia sediminis]|uniref:Uncharacterized protein n=1 Tax=Pseudonocardia sediminis TaxID=1397368 RepID=A0A4V2FQ90_PSEST|nr:hypothetical protein [Pseudonocardia sediminis]RZT83840.1 hypothetical protein EV383_0659 [Pseudonocardia sediminis]